MICPACNQAILKLERRTKIDGHWCHEDCRMPCACDEQGPDVPTPEPVAVQHDPLCATDEWMGQGFVLCICEALAKAEQRTVEAEHDHIVDLANAVLDHVTYDNRFTVFGLLLIQVPSIGWDEAIRRAKASTT